MDFSWITSPASWIALLTLIALELVLGVDNIIFISILAGKLPKEDQPRARTTGIMMAVITRVMLLLSLSWIISLDEPFFHLFGFGISGHDLILIVGGLFLIGKSTFEIHEKLEGQEGHSAAKVSPNFTSVIVQIMLLDIVFSLDSVITAVGMVNEIIIMIIAVIVAAGIMIFLSGPIGDFVERHPTVKMLALSFLLMIGFTLVVEGLHQHIPKGYVYFAMGFSIFVEMINLRVRTDHAKPINLRDAYKEEKMELQTAAVNAANVKPASTVKAVKSKPAAVKPAVKKEKPKSKK